MIIVWHCHKCGVIVTVLSVCVCVCVCVCTRAHVYGGVGGKELMEVVEGPQ